VERFTLGYVILIVLASGVVSFVVYARYHGRERTHRRRTRREGAAERELRADKDHEEI
jgi:hypothetical protein